MQTEAGVFSTASGQAGKAGPAVRKLFVIVSKPHRRLASLQLSSPGRKRVLPLQFPFADSVFQMINKPLRNFIDRAGQQRCVEI